MGRLRAPVSRRTYVRYGAAVLVERWWNGTYGRLARRDLWLHEEGGRWTVEIGMGSLDAGERQQWRYDDEASAREMVRRCLDTGGPGWRRLPTERC
jgi:hypothetical protein